jgi:neutral ceramidase
MMGMGQTAQRTHGLHTRLHSRALIVEDVASSQRVVYVTNNLCMTYGSMMQNITALLQQKYGNLYTYENLMISGEHTHSGPAGYSM